MARKTNIEMWLVRLLTVEMSLMSITSSLTFGREKQFPDDSLEVPGKSLPPFSLCFLRASRRVVSPKGMSLAVARIDNPLRINSCAWASDSDVNRWRSVFLL